MLIFGDTVLKTAPCSLEDVYELDSSLGNKSHQFLHSNLAVIERCVYVMEKEYAIVLNNDASVGMVGSDDATTCTLVFIRSQYATCVAHCDGTDTRNFVKNACRQLQQLDHDFSGNSAAAANYVYEVYLIGSFKDQRGTSKADIKDLLSAMQEVDILLRLRLFCVLDSNTSYSGKSAAPIVYGAAMCLSSGNVQPAKFSATQRGVDYVLRHACNMLSRKMVAVYSYRSKSEVASRRGHFVIEACDFRPNSRAVEYFEQLMSLPDRDLLQRFSTSPDCEPSHFCENARDMFRFLLLNHDPRKFFRNGDRLYETSGTDSLDWKLVSDSG